MQERNFRHMLDERWESTLLCIGLDIDVSRLPEGLQGKVFAQRVIDFNCKIIDATHDLVCCYKINLAHYLAHGTRGLSVLETTFDYGRTAVPDVPLILDGKFGDIAHTN